jgi:Tfp pilus assembly protein PilX
MTRKPFFSRLHDDRGIALPVALAVLFTVAGLATVAARAGIVSSHQSARDKDAKRAAQAANAGLQAAVYQINLMQPSSTQCVLKDPSTGALSNGSLSSGWCTAQAEVLGDGASYAMQVSGPTTQTTSVGLTVLQRTIVSSGTANGVARRTAISVNASGGNPLFPPNYAVAVRDSIDIKNNAVIDGNLGSNGTIDLKNNADVCGNVTPGPGKTPKIGQNFVQCSGYNTNAAAEPLDLQPVDLAGAKASNDNVRITNMKNGSGTPQDTCSACNKITWNSSTKVLAMDGGQLNLSGNVYLFCRFEFTKGTINIPSRSTPLFIFIDTPENCGGTTGMGSAVLDGNFTNLYSPAQAIALLVAGSSTMPTTVELPDNDATNPMGVYAPNSTVVEKNGVEFTGALVAKSIDIKNNAVFHWDTRINGITSGSNIRFYQYATGSYKECTSFPASASTPSDGC